MLLLLEVSNLQMLAQIKRRGKNKENFKNALAILRDIFFAEREKNTFYSCIFSKPSNAPPGKLPSPQ